MPRDGSGQYTLPAGNPVVTGTIVSSTWANTTLSDVAAQLNNVYTRDGTMGPTASLKITDGTAGAPGLSFSSEPSLGFYRVGAGTVGLSGSLTVNGRAATVPVVVPYAAALTINVALSNVFFVAALLGNVTSVALNNGVDGQTINVRFIQDITGGRTVNLGLSNKVAGSINTAPGTVTWLIITYTSADGSPRWEGAWSRIP